VPIDDLLNDTQAVFSLLVCANGSRLPASSEQVMPKLHLAYLVEDVEYPRPEGVQASKEELPHSSRVKRQESSSQAVNSQLEAREEAEKLETEEADAETFSSASAPSGRNAALSAAILRVLEVANARPTPVDPTGSYSGRRRRSAQQEPEQSNDAEISATASTTPGRNAALSAAILRVLEVANASPTPVDPTGSYSGRRRRSAQLEPVHHSNAHQYGLLEPKVELVKVKSHGNYGKVVQASVVAPSAHAKLEHGKRRKRSDNFDNFVPFSVYDDRRVKLLKVEENDFHALPRVIASNKQKRADLEKVEEAKVHVVQLTADQ
jgi:hypothetical protein